MKNKLLPYEQYLWDRNLNRDEISLKYVIKIIESCNTYDQVETAKKLVDRLYLRTIFEFDICMNTILRKYEELKWTI